MVNQIIKYDIDIDFFINFLETICSFKSDKYLLINNASFKKANVLNIMESFLSIIKESYYESKKYYLERKNSYSNFITVLRQVCNKSEIKYVSSIKYLNSTYMIEYYIYYK
jgi:hypothetical protein